MNRFEAAELLLEETSRLIGGVTIQMRRCTVGPDCSSCVDDKAHITALYDNAEKLINILTQEVSASSVSGEMSAFSDLIDTVVINAAELLPDLDPHSL